MQHLYSDSVSSASPAQRRLAAVARHLAPDVLSPAQQPPSVISRQSCSANAARMLEGQVAIITGGGKGIGEATAKHMASLGAAVLVCELDDKAAAKVVQEIQAAGGRASSVSGDVTAPGMADKIVAAAVSAFGGIDIIVNNAGYTWDGMVHKTTPEQWQAMLDVHCTAPFRLIAAAKPYMVDVAKKEIETSGAAKPRCIINISSTSGTHGNMGQANYATAKAGVVGLTKAIAKEWGPFNIRCNAIAFGLIDTRLIRSKEGGESIEVGGKKVALGIPSASQFSKTVKLMTPLQRVGTAEEAAGSVVMMASPLASYVTGQVLEVNGGAFM